MSQGCLLDMGMLFPTSFLLLPLPPPSSRVPTEQLIASLEVRSGSGWRLERQGQGLGSGAAHTGPG